MTARFDFSGKNRIVRSVGSEKCGFGGYSLEDFARDLTHEYKN